MPMTVMTKTRPTPVGMAHPGKNPKMPGLAVNSHSAYVRLRGATWNEIPYWLHGLITSLLKSNTLTCPRPAAMPF